MSLETNNAFYKYRYSCQECNIPGVCHADIVSYFLLPAPTVCTPVAVGRTHEKIPSF